ncbi:SH3 domain-containing protein C23A1,17 [Schizosaccharomyces pombe 972h-] [Rhizoctonia solani]|uniref:SH3 domain-containing protein C23A1,17 [Schizosaccharomyces pombe 972h-] n=1 Tax=Rhizoctonia solani TaxID=456999 RepID=A0A0K6FUF0_9AGAM|nr:SH3 domain-containing protein C23A1,17 [Schizosaccharomyces pombe 972h-] [Rhizoctonia solani]
MSDPNMLGCAHTHSQFNEFFGDYNHVDAKATPQVTPDQSNHTEVTNAASGMDHVPATMQQSRVIGHPHTLTDSSTIYYNSSYGNQNPMYTRSGVLGDKILPQFPKFKPALASTPLPPDNDFLATTNPRPQPRPRPRPPPGFSPIPKPTSAPAPVPTHAPPFAHASVSALHALPPAASVTTKGKGRAASATPCPPAKVISPALDSTRPFVGHGLMKPVRFNHKPSGPSGSRIKRSPSPEYSIRPLSFLPAKSEPEPTSYDGQYYAYSLPISALKAFKSSGRESSPINLCSSSDKADEDDSEVDVIVLGDHSEVPEEWEGDDEDHGGDGSDDGEIPDELEGVEEAYQRVASEQAASTARSSSPLDIDELREMIKKGGKPVMEPEELRQFLQAGRRNKPWYLVEKGIIIIYIFHPSAPAHRSRIALLPINPRRLEKMWSTMSVEAFLSARVASAIAQQCHKSLQVFKDIKYMIEVRGFCVDLTLSKERSVRAIEAALTEARSDGAPLSSATTSPEVYCWVEQGWYEMVDARVGDHPNFRIIGHRSGQVSPRQDTLAGPSKKGKEKRAREDNPLSPQPRDVIRQRPNSKPNSVATHDSFEGIVDVPHLTRSQARDAIPGPSTTARRPSTSYANLPADPPADVESDTKLHAPATKSNSSGTTNGLAGALLDTCASAREFKAQLIDMRKIQLDIDARSVENKYKLAIDEQAAMEEERLYRFELEEERAEREAAELEEKVNRDRQGRFFEEMMHTLNNKHVEGDVIDMVNQQLREKFSHGLASEPFVAPRSVTRHSLLQNLYTRRAASVSVPGPSSSLTIATSSLHGHRPTAPIINPPDSPLHARSLLGLSDQLPRSRVPVTPIPTSTHQLDKVAPSLVAALVPVVTPSPAVAPGPAISPNPVAAPTPVISGSIVKPTILPLDEGSTPSSLSAIIPHISVISRVPVPTVTGTTAPGLSNSNVPTSSGLMSPFSAHTGSITNRANCSSGNTTFGPPTVARSDSRHVTAPTTGHKANHSASLGRSFSRTTSLPQSSITPVSPIPALSRAGSRLDTPMVASFHNRARDVCSSDSRNPSLPHYRSASSSYIDVNPHAAHPEPRADDMVLDSHGMPLADDEFVHVDDKSWRGSMGSAA